MTIAQYLLLAISSLFVVIDPIAIVPVFLAMTPNNNADERRYMAKLASIVACTVLVCFALFGRALFQLLGITMPAFQMAGSIVLLLIALDMLRARRSPVRDTSEETHEGTMKDDIAVTPLAVPMLAGPGAITTVVLLFQRATGTLQHLALLGTIVVVCTATFWILALSSKGAKWLNPLLLRLVERLMGLLLAAIAMQFLINALNDLHIIHYP
jgi:multiple antibiotic resistance protein